MAGLLSKHQGPPVSLVVQAACEMPVTFAQGGLSMIDLVRRSGYMSISSSVSISRISAYIQRHRVLLDAWLNYSENQRCSPAWFIAYKNETYPGYMGWLVGHLVDGKVTVTKHFPDQLSATAFYVKRELEAIKQIIERRNDGSLTP